VAALELRVVGPLEIARGGETVPVTAPKQRALLSLLLLRPNEPVAQDELIEALRGGTAPRTARAALHRPVDGGGRDNPGVRDDDGGRQDRRRRSPHRDLP
jgi:hypothetical protein